MNEVMKEEEKKMQDVVQRDGVQLGEEVLNDVERVVRKGWHVFSDDEYCDACKVDGAARLGDYWYYHVTMWGNGERADEWKSERVVTAEPVIFRTAPEARKRAHKERQQAETWKEYNRAAVRSEIIRVIEANPGVLQEEDWKEIHEAAGVSFSSEVSEVDAADCFIFRKTLQILDWGGIKGESDNKHTVFVPLDSIDHLYLDNEMNALSVITKYGSTVNVEGSGDVLYKVLTNVMQLRR